jgi:hypothetical protein
MVPRIHLHPAIVKEDSVSRQSSIDLFRYGWIHLHARIVKEDSVSPGSEVIDNDVEILSVDILYRRYRYRVEN